MLKTRGESLKGKVCAVSGSGNVAQYTVEKLIQLGAKVVTLSDSNGFIYDEGGIDKKELELRVGAEECAARPDKGMRQRI